MTAQGSSAWRGLLDASRPERARLRELVVKAMEDLARSTAQGAVALGTCNVAPSFAQVQTTSERGD